jgi:hypothetical protein
MNRQSQQPTVITFSAQMYSALLILYPAHYREIYGEQMVQVFQEVARDSYRHQGVVGMAFWWFATALDLIFTAIEQRKEGKATMSESLSIQPLKGSGFGALCILGGLIYFLGGIWLTIGGVPTDPMAIDLTHILRMMWASGTTCGLMGMMVTNATDNGFLARAAAWLSGIGLVIISVDALIALVVHQPVSLFTSSSLPFANLGQVVPLVGWIVLTFLTLSENRWIGWTKLAPLATLLAPIVGLLLGNMLGIRFFPVMIMGLALMLLGFAVKTQLDNKRRDINGFSPTASPDSTSPQTI